MLTINVGRSRKITQDYQSQGFSLNIEGELPSEVLQDQESLQRSTEQLFQLADRLLDEQVRQATTNDRSDRARDENGRQRSPNPRDRGSARPQNDERTHGGRHDGNGVNGYHGTRTSPHDGQRLLTQAQGRAIRNMAHKLGEDPDTRAQEECGVETVEQLTVKQASEIIDLLRQAIESNGQGATR